MSSHASCRTSHRCCGTHRGKLWDGVVVAGMHMVLSGSPGAQDYRLHVITGHTALPNLHGDQVEVW